MPTIRRLVLKNFKRFKTLELEFDPELNILVGGNEAGKSSILQALDIVLSASRSKVEALGIETLFNANCIAEFLDGERKIEDMPTLLVELYLDGIEGQHDLDGRNNSKGADFETADVDQAATYVEGEAKQPQNHEDHKNCPKHNFSFASRASGI